VTRTALTDPPPPPRPCPRGRFAPSPTGPLHFGSLIAAIGSYLEAKAQGGQWLVRIEDIDPPRERPGAADSILRTLEAFGFEWDGPVTYQSRRTDLYEAAIATLGTRGAIFHCGCSRRGIAEQGRLAPDGAVVYPGTCRGGPPRGRKPWALRVRTEARWIEIDDPIQGRYGQDVDRDVGDFVIRRADGCFTYQLAVVVDDADQGITQVVRGCDLLDSTPRQIYLQGLLELPTPRYAHLPVVVDARGDKLSKRTGAMPLDPAHPSPTLAAGLGVLGHAPPAELRRAPAAELWAWARGAWRLEVAPRQRAVPLP
jgi:glutamyl-Q tRNA(Asp) synthetase